MFFILQLFMKSFRQSLNGKKQTPVLICKRSLTLNLLPKVNSSSRLLPGWPAVSLRPQLQLRQRHRIRRHPQRQGARSDEGCGRRGTRFSRHRRRSWVFPVLPIRSVLGFVKKLETFLPPVFLFIFNWMWFFFGGVLLQESTMRRNAAVRSWTTACWWWVMASREKMWTARNTGSWRTGRWKNVEIFY